jgi:hypothetical protein
MSNNFYPGSDQPVTTRLGLALYGMDEVLAENFILLDGDLVPGGLLPEFETNGTPNAAQNILNLIAGTNITLTSNGTGGVTIASTGGGGGSPGGSNGDIQYNSSGTFGGSAATITSAGSITIPSSQSLNDSAGNFLQLGGTVSWLLDNSSSSAFIKNPAGGGSIVFHASSLVLDNLTTVAPLSGSTLTMTSAAKSWMLEDSSGDYLLLDGSGFFGGPLVKLSDGDGDTITLNGGGQVLLNSHDGSNISVGFGRTGISITDSGTGATLDVISENPSVGITITQGGNGLLVTNSGVSCNTAFIPQSLLDNSLSSGTANQVLTAGPSGGSVVWAAPSAGTVTSFSSGNLSPLFTTSVATATTTPAQTFALTNAGANTVFGNRTGSSGAPSYTTAPVVTSITLTDTAANTDLTLVNTTTATSGTTNASPLAAWNANYWTGAASAADSWTLGSSLSAGTNGAPLLALAHTGSSGSSTFQVTASAFSVIGSAFVSGNVQTGNTGQFFWGNRSGLSSPVDGVIALNNHAATGFTRLNFGGTSSSFPALQSSGTTFTVGTADGGTTNGSLLVSSGLAVGSPTGGNEGTGTINAATGYYTNGTAGVSAGSLSAITAITTVGGIVTQLTGTSDERLKNMALYEGGLTELKQIVPYRYTWNEKGQEHTGIYGSKKFVGFSAQNVQANIPEAITGTEKSRDGTQEYLSFDDRPVLACVVNSIKQLAEENRQLRVRLEKLEKDK